MAHVESKSLPFPGTMLPDGATLDETTIKACDTLAILQARVALDYVGTRGFEAVSRISGLRHALSLDKTNDYRAESYGLAGTLSPGNIRTQSTRGWLLKGVVEPSISEAPGDAFMTVEGMCYKNPVAAGFIHFSLEKGIPAHEWRAEELNVDVMFEQLVAKIEVQ